MADIEKVIGGLENCSETNGNCQWKEHPDCPYIERCKAKDYSALNRDALELLKEQQRVIEKLIEQNEYLETKMFIINKLKGETSYG